MMRNFGEPKEPKAVSKACCVWGYCHNLAFNITHTDCNRTRLSLRKTGRSSDAIPESFLALPKVPSCRTQMRESQPETHDCKQLKQVPLESSDHVLSFALQFCLLSPRSFLLSTSSSIYLINPFIVPHVTLPLSFSIFCLLFSFPSCASLIIRCSIPPMTRFLISLIASPCRRPLRPPPIPLPLSPPPPASLRPPLVQWRRSQAVGTLVTVYIDSEKLGSKIAPGGWCVRFVPFLGRQAASARGAER